MSFTDPRFVEIYEQIDGDRTVDLAFYSQIASEANGPILEAGCGSGRILLRLVEEGHQIQGFDPSDAMLDILRARARDRGQEVTVWQGDFGSIESKYRAIISPFNSVMHLLTQQEQVDAFSRVYLSLEEGGIFAFDIANPWTLDVYDEEREFESSFIDQRSGRSIDIWRWFEHDPITQTGKYHREFLIGEDLLLSSLEFRWSYPSEIELLLRLAGFRAWEVFGGFNKESLSESSASQVWVARK